MEKHENNYVESWRVAHWRCISHAIAAEVLLPEHQGNSDDA